jgi:hypothetical protein
MEAFEKRLIDWARRRRCDFARIDELAQEYLQSRNDRKNRRPRAKELPMAPLAKNRAGGGIGGLSRASAISQGTPVQVLEQAAEFKEIGAGIQLGPNVFRMFEVRRACRLWRGSMARSTTPTPCSESYL